MVDQLAEIDPKTSKFKEVADAYRKYGVHLVHNYIQDTTLIGNALLNHSYQKVGIDAGEDVKKILFWEE